YVGGGQLQPALRLLDAAGLVLGRADPALEAESLLRGRGVATVHRQAVGFGHVAGAFGNEEGELRLALLVRHLDDVAQADRVLDQLVADGLFDERPQHALDPAGTAFALERFGQHELSRALVDLERELQPTLKLRDDALLELDDFRVHNRPLFGGRERLVDHHFVDAVDELRLVALLENSVDGGSDFLGRNLVRDTIAHLALQPTNLRRADVAGHDEDAVRVVAHGIVAEVDLTLV